MRPQDGWEERQWPRPPAPAPIPDPQAPAPKRLATILTDGLLIAVWLGCLVVVSWVVGTALADVILKLTRGF